MGSTRTPEWPTCQWNCTFPWNLIPQILVPARLCSPLQGPFPKTSSLPPLRYRQQPQPITSEWPSSPVASHLLSEGQHHCYVLRSSLLEYHHSEAALTWLAGEWPACQPVRSRLTLPLNSHPQDPNHHPSPSTSSSSPLQAIPQNSHRLYKPRCSPHQLEEWKPKSQV